LWEAKTRAESEAYLSTLGVEHDFNKPEVQNIIFQEFPMVR